MCRCFAGTDANCNRINDLPMSSDRQNRTETCRKLVRNVSENRPGWLRKHYGSELKVMDTIQINKLIRHYFASIAPINDELIRSRMQSEQSANPHNDYYKPKRHSWAEVNCILRYEWADLMIKTSEQNNGN